MSDISVIVTAYNREKYLDKALDSLSNQTFKNFDVVLISNFEYDISKYKSLQISHIVLQGAIGKFLAEGIKKASGQIIAFLDDDDYFANDKLETIWKLFKNQSVIYVHNKSQFFNDKQLINKFETKIDFNTSCIEIRKSTLWNHLDILQKITTAPDSFFYFVALQNGGELIKCKKILTYYRMSNDNSSGYNNVEWLLKYKENLLNFKKFFANKKVDKHINKLLILTDFALYNNLGKDYKPKLSNWILFLYYAAISKELTLFINSYKMLIFKRNNKN